MVSVVAGGGAEATVLLCSVCGYTDEWTTKAVSLLQYCLSMLLRESTPHLSERTSGRTN